MSGRRETPDGAGIGRSYGELYVEYAPAARGLALSMVPPDVADESWPRRSPACWPPSGRAADPITRFVRTCSRPCEIWRTTG